MFVYVWHHIIFVEEQGEVYLAGNVTGELKVCRSEK